MTDQRRIGGAPKVFEDLRPSSLELDRPTREAILRLLDHARQSDPRANRSSVVRAAIRAADEAVRQEVAR